MKQLLLLIALFTITIGGIQAQQTNEKWLLEKVTVTETVDNEVKSTEILKADSYQLAQLIGPEEITFVSSTLLRYKRMGSDTLETFSYSQVGNSLEIELSECLLKLTTGNTTSAPTLTERKEGTNAKGENFTVEIVYYYSK